jgi:hypothetical protein
MSPRLTLPAALVLAAVSAVLLAAHLSFDGDTFRHCAYLGPSVRMYVTAWAGPVFGLAALGTAVGRDGRPGGVRAAVVGVAVLLLIVQGFALYGVYAPDPSGGHGCSG